MKRAFAVALAVMALVVSALVAHASSLSVDAGVLQTQSIPVEIEIPDDDHTVTARIRRYNSGNGNYIETVPATPYSWTVVAGKWFTLTWSDPDDVFECPNDVPVGLTVLDLDANGVSAPQQGTGDVDFVICYQTGVGSNSFSLDFIEPPATSTEVNEVAEPFVASDPLAENPSAGATTMETESQGLSPVVRPEDIPDFVGENCSDGGWQQLATADGQPYADEQACVDDQVRDYYAQQREDGS